MTFDARVIVGKPRSTGEPLPVPNMASRSDLLAPWLGRHSPTIGAVEANIRPFRAPHNEISSATDAVSGLRSTLAAYR